MFVATHQYSFLHVAGKARIKGKENYFSILSFFFRKYFYFYYHNYAILLFPGKDKRKHKNRFLVQLLPDAMPFVRSIHWKKC